MTKREFIMQFVLNRATADMRTDGVYWVDQAEKAWYEIEERTRFTPGIGALVRSPTNAQWDVRQISTDV